MFVKLLVGLVLFNLGLVDKAFTFTFSHFDIGCFSISWSVLVVLVLIGLVLVISSLVDLAFNDLVLIGIVLFDLI